MVEVRDLRKRYTTYLRRGMFGREKKVVEALRGISFSIRGGEVFGLLGPNGAGKTTTVKILSTLLLPDGGEAYVCGHDVVREPTAVRKVIGVSLSVERGFFWKLTGRENLTYFGMLYGLDGRDLREKVDGLLDLMGLSDLEAADKLYEEYSLGMKARLSVARALLTDPEVVILDEPTLGLDPPSARALREILVGLAHREGKTVLVTTHNMFEAEIMVDRVAIINGGEIVALGTVDELKARVAGRISLEFLFFPPASVRVDEVVSAVRSSAEAAEVFPEDGGVRLKVLASPEERDEVTSAILGELHGRGCSVRRVEIREPSLEDVFISLTGKTGL